MRTNPAYDAESTLLRRALEERVAAEAPDSHRRVLDAQLALAERNREVYYAKDSDYSTGDLPFGNVRSSVLVGVAPWRGVLVRMMDKRSRVQSFLNKGGFRVEDEKVLDTLLDNSNYGLFGACLIAEEAATLALDELDSARDAFRRIAAESVVAAELHQRSAMTEAWRPEWLAIEGAFDALASMARTGAPSRVADGAPSGGGFVRYG